MGVLLGCGVPLAPVELLASLVRRDRGVMLDGVVLWGHQGDLVAMVWGGKGLRALLVRLARLALVVSVGHMGLLARPASAAPRVGVGLGGLARRVLPEGM